MEMPVERHPFEPFLPANAKLLMLGTFPPSPRRWCMEFYYPNYQNDMWRIFGLLFFGDKRHFLIESEKRFDLSAIRSLLEDVGVALYDTAVEVVRTKNTASDKDLRIITPTDIDALLTRIPECRVIASAGQLATETVASHYGVSVPKVAEYVEFSRDDARFADLCRNCSDGTLSSCTSSRTCREAQTMPSMRLYRMPSSSRAYPMSIEDKAAIYAGMFSSVGLLPRRMIPDQSRS